MPSTRLFARLQITRILATLGMVVLAGCQAPPSTPVASLPPSAQTAAAPPSGQRYLIDPLASELRLLVYRDGPMARLGHNHVISGKVRGEISMAASAAASSFRIEIPVASLEPDRPETRSEEGDDFAAAVSDPARKGTRTNMLSADVLDAANHPLITIRSVSATGPRWNPDIKALVTLRGNTSEVKFPAAVFEQPDTLIVIATFELLQTRLGVQPYSVLGGAIRVRDAIQVRMRLVAHAAPR